MNHLPPHLSQALLEAAARYCELKNLSYAVRQAQSSIVMVHAAFAAMSSPVCASYVFNAKRLYFENEHRDDLELGYEAMDDALGFMYLDVGGDRDGLGASVTIQDCFEAMLQHLADQYWIGDAAAMLQLMVLRDCTDCFASKRELSHLRGVYSSYPHTWLADSIKSQYDDWGTMVSTLNKIQQYNTNGYDEIDPLTGRDLDGNKVREEGSNDSSL